MTAATALPFLSAASRAMTPIAFVKGVAAAYRRYGRDPSEALSRAHIPPDLLKRPDARVTAAQFEALCGWAMRELDDEALGWFARKMPWGAYGMLCRASVTAATLDVALRRWSRHHRILTDDVVFDLRTDGEAARLSLIENRPLDEQREFCLVTLLRYVLGYSCWAVDSAIPLRTASFPFRKPDHVSVYPTIFCKELAFDAVRAEIAFDARYLALPLKRDEADLNAMLKRALPLTVLPYRRDRLIVDRVRELLRDPHNRFFGAPELAETLALSTRTLHRRLLAEGASLRDLKEEARIELARQALVRGRSSIKRVAHAAGFRSEKSFSRAFRQWTGETPSGFRAARRPA
ncbi:MAG: AraC family transcriptional regulator [Hyphomicrobiales bacterium]|nr:AraC family transcriptional regulator [Hyphomicrobiales bacterium]